MRSDRSFLVIQIQEYFLSNLILLLLIFLFHLQITYVKSDKIGNTKACRKDKDLAVLLLIQWLLPAGTHILM